jgi:hypothetical protein
MLMENDRWSCMEGTLQGTTNVERRSARMLSDESTRMGPRMKARATNVMEDRYYYKKEYDGSLDVQ